MKKIVLDSNVIIASFASRGLCSSLFEACLLKYQLIINNFLLKEVEKGLRKKVKLPEPLITEISDFLNSTGEITTACKVPIDSCRDPKDREILGIALTSKAIAIVTGDKDLLVLNQVSDIHIIPPNRFWIFENNNP